jgi:hypothetical protein
MSTASRAVESRIARLCARRFLTMGGMIREEDLAGSPVPDTRWTGDLKAQFQRDLAAGVELLGDRIKTMARQAELLKIFPGVDGLVQMGLRVMINRQVKKLTLDMPEKLRFEFRIEVDRPDLEIDGRGLGLNDIGAQRIDESNRLFLVTQLDWEPGANGDGVWRGPHVQFDQNGPHFQIDLNSLVGLDQAFCLIKLPRPEALGWADVLPYPTFAAKITATDRGRVLGMERWDQQPAGEVLCQGRGWKAGDAGAGVAPLETTIFA